MTGDPETADDRGGGLLTFAGPLLGRRERMAGTHVRRGLVLLGVLLAVWAVAASETADAPGLAMLWGLLTWNAALLGLVAASAGAEAFSAEHARQGGALLRLAETRPLPMAVNLVAPQVGDLLMLVAAQGPLMLLGLTRGGVEAGHAAAALAVLGGWVVLAAAVAGWWAAVGTPTLVAIVMTGMTVGVGELFAGLLSGAAGVELCLSPLGHAASPRIPFGSGLLNCGFQLALAAGFLRLAGVAAMKTREGGLPPVPPTPTGPLRPARGPGVSPRAASRAVARPRVSTCPHRWKGMQLHVVGADGIAVRTILSVALWMLCSLVAFSPFGGLSSAGVILLHFDAALLSARRVRTELDGDPDMIRLLPSGATHAAVETRRGAWPAFVIPLLMLAAGTSFTALFAAPVLDVSAPAYAGVLFLEAVAAVPVTGRIAGMFATRFGVGRSVVGAVVVSFVLLRLVLAVLVAVQFAWLGWRPSVWWNGAATLAAVAAVLLVLRWVGPRDRFLHALVHGRLGRFRDPLPRRERRPA